MVTNGSLVKNFTKKQSGITALNIPTASADEPDKTKINDVEIKLNDIVILNDGTILRCDKIDSSNEPKWTKYEIKNDVLVKESTLIEKFIESAKQAYNEFGKEISGSQQFIFCDGENTIVFVKEGNDLKQKSIHFGLYIDTNDIKVNENKISKTIKLNSKGNFSSTEQTITVEYDSYLCIKDSGNTYKVYQGKKECSCDDCLGENDSKHIKWSADSDKPTITLP